MHSMNTIASISAPQGTAALGLHACHADACRVSPRNGAARLSGGHELLFGGSKLLIVAKKRLFGGSKLLIVAKILLFSGSELLFGTKKLLFGGYKLLFVA